MDRVTHALVGTVPRGPEPPDPPTIWSISSAKAAQTRARQAALDALTADPDGQNTLIELWRREVA